MKIKSRAHTLIFPVLLSSALFTTRAWGQELGSALANRAFEIGFTYRWYERKLEPDFVDGTTWGTDCIYLRYGATNWLTISLEGSTTLWSYTDSRYPNRDYRDLTFGGGLTSTLWARNNSSILIVLDYTERFSFDRSLERYSKQIKSVIAGAELEHRFFISPLEFSVFAAPVFTYDEITQYPPFETYTDKSENNIGVSIGGGIVGYNHVRLFGQFVYASFWQPRLGAGYVF